MSTPTNRNTPPQESIDQRLARLLDVPFLARLVPHLPPEALHHIIQRRGLDECGELVSSATPAQLTSLLDLDLWTHSRAGLDEQFDVERFGEWLEVLVDTGESVAGRVVSSMDTHLVISGLSRYLRVFDPGTLEPSGSSDDEPVSQTDMLTGEPIGGVFECEVGGYMVRARRTDSWDAITSILMTLEAEHNKYFHAVMRGCRGLSNSAAEIDGLDDLLAAPEQQLHDVGIERERRRSRLGYVTPADARVFLRMAKDPQQASTAYLRIVADGSDGPEDTADDRPAEPAPGEAAQGRTRADDDVAASADAVVELLADAGLMPDRPRALLGAADEDPQLARIPLLTRFMESVRHYDEAASSARTREFAFLANALVAGCSVQARPFTPREASDAASSICNLGLEQWPDGWPAEPSPAASTRADRNAPGRSDTFLVDHDLVTAFGVGWSVLHRDVSLFVADRLISTLAALRGSDLETRQGIRALRRKLVEQRKAGTPWLAREAADVLATLDLTAWISVLGLLDECPHVPSALTAVLEHRKTPVSPTAFEFISSSAQIDQIRTFMQVLPSLLNGG